jgi:hypothetical protein
MKSAVRAFALAYRKRQSNHAQGDCSMTRKIALLAAAGLLAGTFAANAQNNPPPGNVNPGSMKSGAEESGAENQPRSNGGAIKGTTGAAPRMQSPSQRDGTNANVKPSSPESGSEPAGEPAPQRR